MSGAEPFRPPVSDVDERAPAATSDLARRSAHLAGAALLLNAAKGLIVALRVWPRLSHLPPAAWVGALVDLTIPAGLDVLLAVPLLRGSVRFRIVTWVRAVLAMVVPGLFAAQGYRALNHAWPTQGTIVLRLILAGTLTNWPVVGSIFLLVTTRPKRWRLLAGGICVAASIALIVAGSLRR